MAQVGIREYDAKQLLQIALTTHSNGSIVFPGKSCLVTPDSDFTKLAKQNPWLKQEKLVVKPDQLFGKRGKHELIGLKLDYVEVQKWIAEKAKAERTIDKAKGKLTHFLIEPFVPHNQEYYVSLRCERERDVISFSYAGGVEIEDNWDKVTEIPVDLLSGITAKDIAKHLKKGVDQAQLAEFIATLYAVFADYHFSFLEINPFAIVDNVIIPLDTVAKVDDTAAGECTDLWGELDFPTSFGRTLSPAEEYIKSLDEKTGASLKLTVLNPKGRVWTMVAGGGASVIYADTISDLGAGKDLANYGEYSGDPSTELTYEYAKTILTLMTENKSGQVLIIGGGIANFTDVAKTFTGIIQALTEFADVIRKQKIRIFVRRGGPNYKEGLANIRAAAEQLKIPLEVYGPEAHMTNVVRQAIDTLH